MRGVGCGRLTGKEETVNGDESGNGGVCVEHPAVQREGPGALLRAVGKGFMAQRTFEQHLEGRVQPVT